MKSIDIWKTILFLTWAGIVTATMLGLILDPLWFFAVISLVIFAFIVQSEIAEIQRK